MALVGGRRPGAGRPKGVPNKTTTVLKDAILKAAELAGGGGKDGLAGYLQKQAVENPGPFMTLLGKVLPLQIAGDPNNPLAMVTRIERVVVGSHEGQDAADRDAACLPTAH